MNERITKGDLIEGNVDKVLANSGAGSVAIVQDRGGAQFNSMLEIMDAAKIMATAGPMIPKWLQGNVGGCWAIIMQAVEWRFSPLSVGRMSYEVNGNVGYMSQLIHAVIEARAPLRETLSCDFQEEGENRRCIVSGHFRSDAFPRIYTSPRFAEISPKNSPLWKSDKDQQLWYYSSRAWARRFCPQVLMGIYSKDELEDGYIGADNAKDVSPGAALHDRLKAASNGGHTEGFRDGVVEDGLNGHDHQKSTQQPQDAPSGPGEAEQAHPQETAPPANVGEKPRRGRKPKSVDPEPAPAPNSSNPVMNGWMERDVPEPAITDPMHPEWPAPFKSERQPDPPQADPALPRHTAKPRTSDEYVTHALAFIAASTDAAELEAEWKSRAERDLRDQCMVVEGAFAASYGAYTKRLAELRAKP